MSTCDFIEHHHFRSNTTVVTASKSPASVRVAQDKGYSVRSTGGVSEDRVAFVDGSRAGAPGQIRLSNERLEFGVTGASSDMWRAAAVGL